MISTKDLKEAELFKGLNAKQLQLFGRHFREEIFKSGEVIFSQGMPARNLYVLLEGEVTLGVKAKDGFDITAYSIVKKGEVFGLSSLVKPYKSNVSATCNKETRTLSIDGKIIRKLLKENSNVGMEIMEKVAEMYFNRLNSSRAMITNLFKMFKFQTGKSKLMETYYET